MASMPGRSRPPASPRSVLPVAFSWKLDVSANRDHRQYPLELEGMKWIMEGRGSVPHVPSKDEYGEADKIGPWTDAKCSRTGTLTIGRCRGPEHLSGGGGGGWSGQWMPIAQWRVRELGCLLPGFWPLAASTYLTYRLGRYLKNNSVVVVFGGKQVLMRVLCN